MELVVRVWFQVISFELKNRAIKEKKCTDTQKNCQFIKINRQFVAIVMNMWNCTKHLE